jgi:ankyrin repeat protein
MLIMFSIISNNLHALSISELIEQEPRRIKVRRGWIPGSRILNLSGVGITSLKGLENIPSIEHVTRLYLNNNSIETIESGELAPAIKLEVLTLSNNGLRSIENNAFAGLKNIKVLDLSSNNIEAVPQEGLNGMPNLRFLGISNNPIPNPKKELQAQIPRAFITTFPITKENIVKWSAIVGASVAALIGAVATVKSLTKLGRKTEKPIVPPLPYEPPPPLHTEILGPHIQTTDASEEPAVQLENLFDYLARDKRQEEEMTATYDIIKERPNVQFILLRQAIENCTPDALNELLKLSDANSLMSKTKNDVTLMDLAILVHCTKKEDKKNMLEALVEKNPEVVNLHGIEGRVPLHWAVLQNDFDLVKFLVAHDAKANEVDKDGKPPLFYGQDVFGTVAEDIADLLLLQPDVELQYVDSQGNTIFHELAGKQNADENLRLVLNLIDRPGAKEAINMENNARQTALDIARENQSAQDIAQAFKNVSKKEQTDVAAELAKALEE